MRRHTNRNSGENLSSLLSAIEKQTMAPDPKLLKQLRERSAQEFAVRASNLPANPSKSIHLAAMRSTIMKSPWAKVAVAAAVLVAGVIGLSLWKTTGSGVALADIVARVEQIKAFRCKTTRKLIHEAPADKPPTWQIHDDRLVSKEYGLIIKLEQRGSNGEQANLSDLYFNAATNIMVLVEHTQKRYNRAQLDSWLAQQIQKEFGRYGDAVAVLKEIAASKYESIGRSTIDGIAVEGFRTTDPNCGQDGGFGLEESQVDVKLWIDVKTFLPVRYESLTTGLDQTGARASFQVVMYDFLWDVTVDAPEFEPPTVPDGYTAQVQAPWGATTEQTVMESLKQYAALFGKYPESLNMASSSDMEDDLNRSDTPGAVRLREELKELAEPERAKRLADIRLLMVRSFMFYMNLTTDKKEPAYYGQTVTPADTDKVLMRWKVSDSEYRVIFGNLQAETVSADTLAKLEESLPN